MTTALQPVTFHFDAVNHVYTVGGVVRPHITGMLQELGIADDLWFTEESSQRGTAVHDLTAAYDLGALDPRTLVSGYKNYVLAHVAAMQLLRPQMLAVEEPEVHPKYLFGGRPDRVAKVHKVLTIIEIKTGVKSRPVRLWGRMVDAHQTQTALQAILVAWRYGLEPQMFQRLAVYEKPTGRAHIETHRDPVDFVNARRVIKECCHV
jgi:hypothetical protein